MTTAERLAFLFRLLEQNVVGLLSVTEVQTIRNEILDLLGIAHG